MTRFLIRRILLGLLVLWLITVYLLWDSALLVFMFGLWVASGFGWRINSPAFRRAHYRLGARGIDPLARSRSVQRGPVGRAAALLH